MFLLAQTLALLPLSLAATYTLNHRWISPDSARSPGAFTKYATVDLPDTYDVSQIIRLEGSDPKLAIEGGDEGVKGWYQVQLVGEGLEGGAISSIKAVRAVS
jgi:hypothetical protein